MKLTNPGMDKRREQSCMYPLENVDLIFEQGRSLFLSQILSQMTQLIES